MKKIFALLLSLLCILSCFILPVSAATTVDLSMELTSTADVSIVYHSPAESYDGWKIGDYVDTSDYSSESFTLSITHAYSQEDFDDFANTATDFYTGAVSFKTKFKNDYSDFSGDDYDLIVEWQTSSATNYDGIQSCFPDEIESLREIINIPCVFGNTNYTEFTYDDSTLTFTGTYTYTDSAVDAILSASEHTFTLPIEMNCASLNVYVTAYLQPHADVTDPPTTTAPTTPSTPNIPSTGGAVDFANPNQYEYLADFKFGNLTATGSGEVTDKVSIYDFYADGQYRIRDYTDKFIVTDYTSAYSKYNLVFGSVYANGTTEEDFVDSSFEEFTFSLPCTVNLNSVLPDTSQLGFRMEWYFDLADGIGGKFSNAFYDSIENGSQFNFFGFESFSLYVKDCPIPTEYFTIEPSTDGKQMRVTLDLDGRNETHRMFMNKILTHDGRAEITFVADDYFASGLTVGIGNSGFYKKYDTPIGGTSTDNSGGGFSQEDIDNAYNKGKSDGLAEGSDKNYVYGFVNGIWHSFTEFFFKLMDEISIGGIALGSIVASVIILVVVFVVIKVIH